MTFQVKHYKEISEKGWPIVIIAKVKYDNKNQLEIFKIFLNYNSDEFTYNPYYITLTNNSLSNEDLFESAFRNIETDLEQLSDKDLKERKVSGSGFHIICTSPSFRNIKNEIIRDTQSNDLKQALSKFEYVDFQLKPIK